MIEGKKNQPTNQPQTNQPKTQTPEHKKVHTLGKHNLKL